MRKSSDPLPNPTARGKKLYGEASETRCSLKYDRLGSTRTPVPAGLWTRFQFREKQISGQLYTKGNTGQGKMALLSLGSSLGFQLYPPRSLWMFEIGTRDQQRNDMAARENGRDQPTHLPEPASKQIANSCGNAPTKQQHSALQPSPLQLERSSTARRGIAAQFTPV